MGVEESCEERNAARKLEKNGRDCWVGGGILGVRSLNGVVVVFVRF